MTVNSKHDDCNSNGCTEYYTIASYYTLLEGCTQYVASLGTVLSMLHHYTFHSLVLSAGIVLLQCCIELQITSLYHRFPCIAFPVKPYHRFPFIAFPVKPISMRLSCLLLYCTVLTFTVLYTVLYCNVTLQC